ncbi:MAG TPA: hypothetical protein V6C58_17720 [Allocoleopsis sp.]
MKIISKIPENGRIKRTFSGSIELETETLSGIKRFLMGDSRTKAIEDITSAINSAFEHCELILESTHFNKNLTQEKEYSRRLTYLLILHTELKNSINGLRNLKITYQHDVTTVSKLDILITRINNFVEELGNVLDEKKINLNPFSCQSLP